MRFFANGPSIPDLLLEQRDKGQVVFFCGAGVSVNAGMPCFSKLTQHVVDYFDPSEGSEITNAFNPWRENSDQVSKTPLDQVFQLLYQEYDQVEVNEQVTEKLTFGGNTSTEFREHELIARISSDVEGKPQIVTTNFDLLFEHAIKEGSCRIDNIDIHEPPALPEIKRGDPITGITYLHGRLHDSNSQHHNYVLSSADLGRAYLSEAWATRFVLALLDSYTVVLVGYKAEDPPVQYLLWGLNHDQRSDRTKLYAFDRGKPEEVETRWRDRGVTPIAYEQHRHLWKTLGAWAERADDSRAWRTQVIDLAAKKGPRQLCAHQRGQVAHVVRTTAGARQFAKVDPSPTAEWLFVFDSSCRTAEKVGGYGVGATTFDPLQEFGLDDDPPRPPESGHYNLDMYDHLLQWRRGDTNPPGFHRLGGRHPAGHEPMPQRLQHLTDWVVNHLDEPATAWWAIRQSGLHPRLAIRIRRKLSKTLDSRARHSWHLILEYQSDPRQLMWNDGWYDCQVRINEQGWTPGVLREFEAVTSPLLSEKHNGPDKLKPPFTSWQEIKQYQASWEVKLVNRHCENIEIPDDVLGEVFRIAEGHLRRASGLLRDINKRRFRTPSCYPGRETKGPLTAGENGKFFLWFLKLFDRFVKHDPKSLRAHVIAWPENDEFFFRKLRLFALNRPELFDADEAAEELLGLHMDSFWDGEVRREFLFLIKDRWEDFENEHRRLLVDRLLEGPARGDDWSEEEYTRSRNLITCRYLKWLTLNGVTLYDDQSERLENIKHRIPGWNDSWACSIVTESGMQFGVVKFDEKPDELLDLPDGKVVGKAIAINGHGFRGFTVKEPFKGLVEKYPRKALSALTIASRKQCFPIGLWETLIGNWPEQNCPRLNKVFVLRLGRLPNNVIWKLRDCIGHLIEQRFKDALACDQAIAWTTFDHLVTGLMSRGESATESALGKSIPRKGELDQSRRTYEDPFASPFGMTTDGLLSALGELSLDDGKGIPGEFKTRLGRLLQVPDEGRDHAVSILTHKVSWLYSLDPDWVQSQIIPLFDFKHPVTEPAWSGFLHSIDVPTDPIWSLLKVRILELPLIVNSRGWEHDLAKYAANWVVRRAVSHQNEPGGLTASETRKCLRCMDEETRNHVIQCLRRIGTKNGTKNENGWRDLVIPFVENSWPKEKKYRTGSSVLSWASLLVWSDNMFPSVLDTVRRYLVPTEEIGRFFGGHWLVTNDDNCLTSRYPKAVLELFDAVVSGSQANAPSELEEVLEIIAEKNPYLIKDRRFIRLINLVEN